MLVTRLIAHSEISFETCSFPESKVLKGGRNSVPLSNLGGRSQVSFQFRALHMHNDVANFDIDLELALVGDWSGSDEASLDVKMHHHSSAIVSGLASECSVIVWRFTSRKEAMEGCEYSTMA